MAVLIPTVGTGEQEVVVDPRLAPGLKASRGTRVTFGGLTLIKVTAVNGSATAWLPHSVITLGFPVRLVVGSAVVGETDTSLYIDASGGAATVTIPLAATYPGKIIVVYKTDASANFVNLIGGLSGSVTQQGGFVILQSDGVTWRILGAQVALGVIGVYLADDTIAVGDQVTVTATGAKRARAADGTLPSRAVALTPATAGIAVAVRYSGEQDGYAGLTVGATQYLDATTFGAITSVAPAADGNIVQAVGFAKSASVLVVTPDETWETIRT